MSKNGIYIIVIVLLLGCTIYLGYDKFFTKSEPCNNSCVSDNVSKSGNVSKSDNVLDKFVGKYVSSEYDESKLDELDKYTYLEINSDGTAVYKKVFKSGSGESAKGKIAASDNKLYIFNDECIKPEVVGTECVYVNCKPIIELSYNGDTLVVTHNSIELKKVSN